MWWMDRDCRSDYLTDGIANSVTSGQLSFTAAASARGASALRRSSKTQCQVVESSGKCRRGLYLGDRLPRHD